MNPNDCRLRISLPAVLSLVLAFLLIPTGEVEAQGKGGGKPPKDPPPLTDPVLVYQRGNDLIVADATGTNSRIVHRLGEAGGTADWSPDGSEIVFVDLLAAPLGDCVAGWALLRLNVFDAIAGTHLPTCIVQLRGQSLEVNNPSWTASGIFYADLATVDNVTQWDLFWVDPLEKAPVNLTQTSLINEQDPTVSPEGNQLVYVRYELEYPEDLRIASFDSSNRVLTEDRSLIAGTVLDGFDNIREPDWSNVSTCGTIAVRASTWTPPYIYGIWVLDTNTDVGCQTEPLLVTGALEWVHGTPSWSASDTDIVLLTHLKNTCGYRKGANGFLLGIIPWTGDAVPCAEQFIGPAGRDEFPRSLDWWRP